MTGWRRWKSEEKLALINEIRERGHIVETCRKYGVDPSMFYLWKEIYDIYGVDDFRYRTRHPDPGAGNLKKENEKLKKIVAKKEPEVSMFQEGYKKTRMQRS